MPKVFDQQPETAIPLEPNELEFSISPDGSNPYRALPESPLSFVDRMKLAILEEGHGKKAVAKFLAEKFGAENILLDKRNGNFLIRKDGKWHYADPDNGKMEGSFLSNIGEYITDIGEAALKDIDVLASIGVDFGMKLASVPTGGTSIIASAAINGAVFGALNAGKKTAFHLVGKLFFEDPSDIENPDENFVANLTFDTALKSLGVFVMDASTRKLFSKIGGLFFKKNEDILKRAVLVEDTGEKLILTNGKPAPASTMKAFFQKAAGLPPDKESFLVDMLASGGHPPAFVKKTLTLNRIEMMTSKGKTGKSLVDVIENSGITIKDIIQRNSSDPRLAELLQKASIQGAKKAAPIKNELLKAIEAWQSGKGSEAIVNRVVPKKIMEHISTSFKELSKSVDNFWFEALSSSLPKRISGLETFVRGERSTLFAQPTQIIVKAEDETLKKLAQTYNTYFLEGKKLDFTGFLTQQLKDAREFLSKNPLWAKLTPYQRNFLMLSRALNKMQSEINNTAKLDPSAIRLFNQDFAAVKNKLLSFLPTQSQKAVTEANAFWTIYAKTREVLRPTANAKTLTEFNKGFESFLRDPIKAAKLIDDLDELVSPAAEIVKRLGRKAVKNTNVLTHLSNLTKESQALSYMYSTVPFTMTTASALGHGNTTLSLGLGGILKTATYSLIPGIIAAGLTFTGTKAFLGEDSNVPASILSILAGATTLVHATNAPLLLGALYARVFKSPAAAYKFLDQQVAKTLSPTERLFVKMQAIRSYLAENGFKKALDYTQLATVLATTAYMWNKVKSTRELKMLAHATGGEIVRSAGAMGAEIANQLQDEEELKEVLKTLETGRKK